MTLHRKFLVAIPLAMLAGGLCTAAFGADLASPSLAAVWKEQQIEFRYAGGGGVYTCAALQQKIRSILLDLGARADPEIRVQGCVNAFQARTATFSRNVARQESAGLEVDVSTDPFITINVATLFEATPRVMRELAAQQGEQDLKARFTGEGEADADFAVPLPAEPKRVRLTGRTRYLDPGDCSLIDQIRMQVLPKLDVRAVVDASTCHRRSFSLRLGQPNLSFEALIPVAAETQSTD